MLNKIKIIGILGAGKWGRAFASMFYNRENFKVKFYDKKIQKDKIIGNFEFYKKLSKLNDCDIFVLVVPTAQIRNVFKKLKRIYKNQPILGLSKGIEKKSFMFSHQIVNDVLSKNVHYAHLSGPSFSKEIINKLPTKLTIAFKKDDEKYFKVFFHLPTIKIEKTSDIIGVELGGAFKNIIAIAAGISDGLKYGDNFRSWLILEGFHQMIYLGKKLAAKKETFFKSCGLGDLILTATSLQSRNYSYGFSLAKRKRYPEKTIEGRDTCFAVYNLSKKLKISLPIVEFVFRIVYKKEDPKKRIEILKDKMFNS